MRIQCNMDKNRDERLYARKRITFNKTDWVELSK